METEGGQLGPEVPFLRRQATYGESAEFVTDGIIAPKAIEGGSGIGSLKGVPEPLIISGDVIGGRNADLAEAGVGNPGPARAGIMDIGAIRARMGRCPGGGDAEKPAEGLEDLQGAVELALQGISGDMRGDDVGCGA